MCDIVRASEMGIEGKHDRNKCNISLLFTWIKETLLWWIAGDNYICIFLRAFMRKSAVKIEKL
jgi:hypothetical protein